MTENNKRPYNLVDADGQPTNIEDFTNAGHNSEQLNKAVEEFRLSLKPIGDLYQELLDNPEGTLNLIAVGEDQYNFDHSDLMLAHAAQKMIEDKLPITVQELQIIEKIGANVYVIERGYLEGVAEKDEDGHFIVMSGKEKTVTSKDLIEALGKARNFALLPVVKEA